jgi:hypothetical protein
MDVWIPPEFQGIKKENIVTSISNDWGNIGSTSKSNVEATHFPNRWTRVRVNSDSALTGLNSGQYIVFGNATFGDVWVYVRVNDVIAPTIAGKYFFKIGLRVRGGDAYPGFNTNVNSGDYIWLGDPEKPYGSFNTNGVPNWPVLLVKGEVDPAYADGTIRYGGYHSSSYYGQPLQLPGRVRFVGRAIDPFTLQPTDRPVEARGYFNATANGHFEVEGIAPGIYDIYASAAGYPERLIQSQVTILKGQSYHIDAYLTPGVVIEGEVFSKCGTGEVNWVTWQQSPTDDTNHQDIKIEIYKVGSVPTAVGTVCSVTEENIEGITCRTATEALVWSPVDRTEEGWGDFVHTFGDGDGPGPWDSQFAWPGYGGEATMGVHPMGVGPAQDWQVLNTQANFHWQMGDKGLYGVPTLFDGHVPQLPATYVDGLPAGSYEVRAFTYGYVQTKVDGITFEHVTFIIPDVEWPGDIYIPFDLRLNNYIKKTVHFHDVPGTLAEDPVPGTPNVDGRHLYMEAVDAQDGIWGWKVNYVNAGETNEDIYTRGIRAQSMSYWGDDAGRNYGIPSGTYTIKAYMYGYVEQVFEKVTIGLCGSEIAISDHLYRGVMFNVTFYSKDWQHPTVDKPWKYKDEWIYLQIWKDGKQLVGEGIHGKNGNTYNEPGGDSWTSDGTGLPLVPAGSVVNTRFRVIQGDYVQNVLGQNWNDDLPASARTFATLYYEGQEADNADDEDPGYYPMSFESGLYEFIGLTYGYVMQMDPVTRTAKPFQLYATKGGVANIPIKLIVGVQIPLIIRFKHEQIFEHLRFNSTVRVRIFDDQDNLVGEWFTSNSINGTDPVLSDPYILAADPRVWHGGNIIKGTPESALPCGSLPSQTQALHNILGPGYSHAVYDTTSGFPGIESMNYVPRSTEMLNITICGLPDPYVCGSGVYYANNGFDRVFDVAPWTPGKYGAPGAPYGINGQPWYTGGYYVETEVVPFGRDVDNLHTYTANGLEIYDGWYPPVAGLLYGESCTIDPRTGMLYPWAIAVNHIGPYQQRVHVTLPGAHLGGESSGIFELDLLGLARGVVYSYTWCDDWRTTSWISVLFSGAAGTFTIPTWDGVYEAYLPAGTWSMKVVPWTDAGQGYHAQSFTLAVSDGQVGGYNVYLEESGIPIPEYTTPLIVLASALAAALTILKRRRRK